MNCRVGVNRSHGLVVNMRLKLRNLRSVDESHEGFEGVFSGPSNEREIVSLRILKRLLGVEVVVFYIDFHKLQNNILYQI